jgi:ParB family chromosome partitioning protein
MEEDAYEIISGHRRLHACKKAGITAVPALIYSLDRNAAAIALVDSNLHREHILPSEKAFAYKLKMDALSRQGQRTDLTSRQLVGKLETADMIAENESGRQVQRYIRLTHLLPELLEKVDEGKIAFTPAVHLSYLSPAEQGWVLDEMERNDCTPSVGQAYHLKEHSMAGTLTRDFVAGLMSQEKANQKERLKIPMERIRKYFPKHYTTAQMEDAIVKMCEAQFRRRTDRDAR